MIGTILRLGFDANQVRAGLANIGGLLGRFSRQVGVGMARQVGARMTDTLGRLISYLPEATSDLLDYAGGMNDMSAQTGMSTKQLMVMEEAFRGVTDGGVDAGRMIATMRDNLYSAATGAGAARDALHKLGFGAQDLIDMEPAKQIEAIGRALERMGSNNPAFESVVKDLFGGRIGIKGIGLMKDFTGAMKSAESTVGSFGDESEILFKKLDIVGEKFGEWTMIRRELTASLLKGAFGKELENAETITAAIMDSLRMLKPVFQSIGSALAPIMKGFAMITKDIQRMGVGGFFGEIFSGIGEAIGNGIKKSIGDSLNPMNAIKGMFGGGKTSMNSNNPLLKETMAQTNILERIYREKSNSQFA